MYGHDVGRPSVEIEFRPPSMPEYVAVVSLRGEHDIRSAGDVSTALGMLSGDALVDLSACTFIDSTLIGLIIRTARRVHDRGGQVDLLVTPGSAVARRLELVDTNPFLTLYDHRSRAVVREAFILRLVDGRKSDG
jgi:anti-sigma B factor antagonist